MTVAPGEHVALVGPRDREVDGALAPRRTDPPRVRGGAHRRDRPGVVADRGSGERPGGVGAPTSVAVLRNARGERRARQPHVRRGTASVGPRTRRLGPGRRRTPGGSRHPPRRGGPHAFPLESEPGSRSPAGAPSADAPVVLLDEPAAHLDPATEGRLADALAGWFEERTVVVAAHRPEIVTRLDRIVTLAGPRGSRPTRRRSAGGGSPAVWWPSASRRGGASRRPPSWGWPARWRPSASSPAPPT